MPVTAVIVYETGPQGAGGKQYIVHLYPQKYGTFNVGP